MWMDNLKEWRFYLEENRHTPVDIAGWFGKIRKQLRSFMTSLRRDMHHQANASRHRTCACMLPAAFPVSPPT